jgi:hypothetical protein
MVKATAFAASLAAILAVAGAARACEGAGVILRIEGQPQDVQILRADGGPPTQVARPRVLEVICRDDVVRTVGLTYVMLAIDGAGTVRVDHTIAYTVPPRSGAPTIVGNAYRRINEQIMPDMKRLPWNVRIKGAGDDFGFALPGLAAGGQQIEAGTRAMLVRLVGGTAPYRVEVRDANNATIAMQTSPYHEVVLDRVSLPPGAYHLVASDSTPRSLQADITAVSTPPPSSDQYVGVPQDEIRVALDATTLAREQTGAWSFEAEQDLYAAPAEGLDRDKVYELIESYGSD